MNSLVKQSFEKLFGDIAIIPVELTIKLVDKALHLQGFSVIDITTSKHKINHMATVADDQVQFEAIKPANQSKTLWDWIR